MSRLADALGVLKLQAQWVQSGQNISNILHIFKPALTAWGLGDATDAATRFADAIGAQLTPGLTSDINNTSVTATDLTSNMGVQVTVPGAGAGGKDPIAHPPLPQSNTVRVTYNTPLRYRGGRPGICIPGLVQEDIDPTDRRLWTVATRDGYVNSVETIFSLITDPPFSFGHAVPCVVSYFSGHAPRVTPLVLPITSLEGQLRICSRRRRLGRGIAGG